MPAPFLSYPAATLGRVERQIELPADRTRLTRLAASVATACAGVVGIGVVYQWRGDVPPVALWAIVALGLVVAVGTMARTVVRVVVGESEVVLHRYLGTTVIPRADVHGAVAAETYHRPFAVPCALLLLLGKGGRPVCRLSGLTFAYSDLVRLASVAGGAVTWLDVAEPRTVSEHAPHALGFLERRPVAAIVLATFGLLIGCVVLAGVLVGTGVVST